MPHELDNMKVQTIEQVDEMFYKQTLRNSPHNMHHFEETKQI